MPLRGRLWLIEQNSVFLILCLMLFCEFLHFMFKDYLRKNTLEPRKWLAFMQSSWSFDNEREKKHFHSLNTLLTYFECWHSGRWWSIVVCGSGRTTRSVLYISNAILGICSQKSICIYWFWAIPGSAQGLLLALSSEITSARTQGTMWVVGN